MSEQKPVEVPNNLPIALPLAMVNATLGVLAKLPAGEVANLLIALDATTKQQVGAYIAEQNKPTAVKLPDTLAVRAKKRRQG